MTIRSKGGYLRSCKAFSTELAADTEISGRFSGNRSQTFKRQGSSSTNSTDSTGGLTVSASVINLRILRNSWYLPAILVHQGVGSRGDFQRLGSMRFVPGVVWMWCTVWESLLRHNIRVDIVYCYPSDDFNGVKNFNAIITTPVICWIMSTRVRPRGNRETAFRNSVFRKFADRSLDNWPPSRRIRLIGVLIRNSRIYLYKDKTIVSEVFSH